jgi:hypothetical protein
MLLEYVEGGKDKLQVAGKGEGGLAAVREKLNDELACFAYIRMTVGNDELSQRAKFVVLSWCGMHVKVMRRAKMSVHFASVKKVISQYAIQIEANDLDQLGDEEVTVKLKKAMGANYDRQAATDY